MIRCLCIVSDPFDLLLDQPLSCLFIQSRSVDIVLNAITEVTMPACMDYYYVTLFYGWLSLLQIFGCYDSPFLFRNADNYSLAKVVFQRYLVYERVLFLDVPRSIRVSRGMHDVVIECLG